MSVDDTLTINRCTNPTLWVDIVEKKMKNINVPFNTLEDDTIVPHGFHFVKFRLIVDNKNRNIPLNV